MTKNGLDIQTISAKRTDLQTDRVLHLGQLTEEEEKANPSYFLKFLLASRTNGTTCPDLWGFGFDRNTDSYRDSSFAKPKSLSRHFGKPFLPPHQ
jgi:hypothetical protein